MSEGRYDEISIIDIIKVIKKNLPIISILLVVFVLVSGIVTYFFIPNKFKSSTIFFVQQKGSSAVSDSLSMQVGIHGGLMPYYPDKARTGPMEEIVMSKKFLEEILKEQGLDAEPTDIESFKKLIDVEDRESGSIGISVEWTEPKVAHELVKRILEKYTQEVEEQITTFNDTNREYLEEQYEKSKERLTLADEALASFQKEKGIIHIPDEIQIVGLEDRLTHLDGEYDVIEGAAKDLPDNILKYNRLLREQKEAEQIYMLMSTQLEQAKIAEDKEHKIVVQVIDPPAVPHKKSSPSTSKNVMIAGVLALFVGIFQAFVREYLGAYKKELKETESI